MEWNKNLGHLSSEKFISVMNKKPDIPLFSVESFQSIMCYQCYVYKSKRLSVRYAKRISVRPLKIIHMDIVGPMLTKEIVGRMYKLGRMDEWTENFDVSFLSEKRFIHEETK